MNELELKAMQNAQSSFSDLKQTSSHFISAGTANSQVVNPDEIDLASESSGSQKDDIEIEEKPVPDFITSR